MEGSEGGGSRGSRLLAALSKTSEGMGVTVPGVTVPGVLSGVGMPFQAGGCGCCGLLCPWPCPRLAGVISTKRSATMRSSSLSAAGAAGGGNRRSMLSLRMGLLVLTPSGEGRAGTPVVGVRGRDCVWGAPYMPTEGVATAAGVTVVPNGEVVPEVSSGA